jgi:hypothetical protein
MSADRTVRRCTMLTLATLAFSARLARRALEE